MTSPIHEKAILISNQCLAPNLYLAKLKAPLISKVAHPGQYMKIIPADYFEKPRSFSFFGINPQKETVEIYYQLRGEGTHYMAENWHVGDEIDIEGPCGDGFHYGKNKKTLIIGAGVGLAPMKALIETLQRHHQTFEVLIGARSENFLKILELFPENVDYRIVTDDGSIGKQASILEALEDLLNDEENKGIDSIIACGPDVVLKEVERLGTQHDIIVQSSYTCSEVCPLNQCFKCENQIIKEKNYEQGRI